MGSGPTVPAKVADKGKGKMGNSSGAVAGASAGNSGAQAKRKNSDSTPAVAAAGEEMKDQRPKVISPELRGLLSRKFKVVPHDNVKKDGARAGKK